MGVVQIILYLIIGAAYIFSFFFCIDGGGCNRSIGVDLFFLGIFGGMFLLFTGIPSLLEKQKKNIASSEEQKILQKKHQKIFWQIFLCLLLIVIICVLLLVFIRKI